MAKRAIFDPEQKVVINPTLARKVLSIVDKGLSQGMGSRTPGNMCIEAAVCYAIGQPHDDKPVCVHQYVRDLKIHINDHIKCTNSARAKIMRRLAIAQLGTSYQKSMDKFDDMVVDALTKARRAQNKAILEKELPAKLKQFKEDVLCGGGVLESNDFCLLPVVEATYAEGAFEEYIVLIDDLNSIHEACEIIVQVLVKLKTPGSKFLTLAPFKKLTAKDT